MKNKKNIFLLIGTALVVLGLILALPTAAMGTATSIKRNKSGIYLDGARYNERVGETENTDKTIIIEEESLPSFSSIDINVGYTDIYFEKAAQPGLKLQYKESSPLEWSVEDGVLSVKEKYNTGNNSYSVYFDISFLFPKAKNDDHIEQFSPKIIVYLPFNTELSSLTIKTENSGCTISDISALETSIKSNYGSVYLSNMSLGNADIKGENADMRLKDIEAKTIDVKNTYGSLTLNSFAADNLQVAAQNCDFHVNGGSVNAVTIKNSYGPVTIEDSELKSFTLFAENSAVNIRNSKIGRSEIKNTYGTIKASNFTSGGFISDTENCEYDLEGAFTGMTKISSSYGSVRIATSIAKNEYDWDLDTQYGTVSIDGEKREGSVRNESSANNFIFVSGENADIALVFAK